LAINHDRPNEQLGQSVRDCLAQARELIAPRAVYELLTVVGRGPDWIEDVLIRALRSISGVIVAWVEDYRFELGRVREAT